MSIEIAEYLTIFQCERERYEESINQLTKELKDIYPDKIFIYEDKRAKKLWEKFFKSANINGVTMYCSYGADNDSCEIVFHAKLKEKKGSYRPLIFRQVDRDGLTNSQIQKIQTHKNFQ